MIELFNNHNIINILCQIIMDRLFYYYKYDEYIVMILSIIERYIKTDCILYYFSSISIFSITLFIIHFTSSV